MPTPFAASDRLRLATLARDTALATAGVHALDPGPARAFVTAGAGEIVGGVNCVAAPDGGYDLDLHLVCDLVPLHPLGDRIRTAIQAAAAGEHLIAQTVSIRITDVVGPEDDA